MNRWLRRLTIAWYGGGAQRVHTLSRTGHSYKSGNSLMPIHWVSARNRIGTHRDEFFFSTNPAQKSVPQAMNSGPKRPGSC